MNRSIINTFKNALRPFPRVQGYAQRLYRRNRTSRLRSQYREGAFLNCNGAQVFCDFQSDNYRWYDGDSAYLAIRNGGLYFTIQNSGARRDT